MQVYFKCCIVLETKTEQIEEEFNRLTSRDDIAILLINQKV